MPRHTERPDDIIDHAAQMRDVLAESREDRDEIKALRRQLDEALALLWIGWSEMNAIRARSGVPLDFDGRPQAIVEGYWDEAVDKMAEFLGRYDMANPWPPKHFTLTWTYGAGDPA